MSMKNSAAFSRRKFVATGAGAAFLGPAWLQAAVDAADPRLAGVRATTIAIDMHNHVFASVPNQGFRMGDWLGLESDSSLGLSGELRKAGFTAVVAGHKLPFDRNAKPGELQEKFLGLMSKMDALLEKEHMRRALHLKDLQEAHRLGQPTIVQAIEGAQFLEGHLERVEIAYKRGLRHLQLLHDDDDLVSPLGDLDAKPAHLGGLTAFGAKVIHECNRLGIVVDMAHGSPETILAASKVSTKPFIVSHTGFQDSSRGGFGAMDAMMQPRLLNKERAKVVADADGVIGIWLIGSRSPSDYVENVKRMVDAAGIDHVGIGTDSDLLSERGTNSVWSGVTGGFFNIVAIEMLRQGFAPDEIAKFGGGNYCRVFDQATKGQA